MPKEFTDFLDFYKYDVIFLLQNLASSIFTYGESYLTKSKNYNFCILEVIFYCSNINYYEHTQLFAMIFSYMQSANV